MDPLIIFYLYLVVDAIYRWKRWQHLYVISNGWFLFWYSIYYCTVISKGWNKCSHSVNAIGRELFVLLEIQKHIYGSKVPSQLLVALFSFIIWCLCCERKSCFCFRRSNHPVGLKLFVISVFLVNEIILWVTPHLRWFFTTRIDANLIFFIIIKKMLFLL